MILESVTRTAGFGNCTVCRPFGQMKNDPKPKRQGTASSRPVLERTNFAGSRDNPSYAVQEACPEGRTSSIASATTSLSMSLAKAVLTARRVTMDFPF